MNGGNGDDLLNGNLGEDLLDGNAGDDTVFGGQDNDAIWVVLGDSTRAYYNDGNNATPGIGDYALIREFIVTEDTLQLKAGLSYLIGASPPGLLRGAAIFIDNDGLPGLTTNDELISVIRNLTPADAGLITSRFSFV